MPGATGEPERYFCVRIWWAKRLSPCPRGLVYTFGPQPLPSRTALAALADEPAKSIGPEERYGQEQHYQQGRADSRVIAKDQAQST